MVRAIIQTRGREHTEQNLMIPAICYYGVLFNNLEKYKEMDPKEINNFKIL